MMVELGCEIDLGSGPQAVAVEALVAPRRAFLDPRCPYPPTAVILTLVDSAGRIIDRPIPGPIDKKLKEEAIAALRRSPFLPQLLEERSGDATPQ